MANNISYIPTEEEVLREIAEYNNRRSGPILDGINKAKGIERFLAEESNKENTELLNAVEKSSLVGLDSDHSTLEN